MYFCDVNSVFVDQPNGLIGNLSKRCTFNSVSSISQNNEVIKQSSGSVGDDVENFCIDSAEADIVIDRVSAVTLKATVAIEGQLVHAVVDRGAEVTVMSEKMLLRIPENKRPHLSKAKGNLVVAEAGKKMCALGVAEVSIHLGPLEFFLVYLCLSNR
ncbi:unnamed protein product [Mytilus coruscus]|uniref:Peptidase A2 domain-containing protein n=1 Tax=Mytilus coruscus TaxID=42192 RepID=A0A6J8BCN3_MYTCO|nr:unnamed protein product [Mytilus coruscus]